MDIKEKMDAFEARQATKRRKERLWYTTVVMSVGSLLLSGWILYSHFEARAYEQVTGKSVSTWDAMFLDLRVQEGAK